MSQTESGIGARAGASVTVPPPLHADRAEITRFISALFRHADEGTFVSLRAFHQTDRSVPPLLIRPVRINGEISRSQLAETAALAIEKVANGDQPAVFSPPICTFTNSKRGRGVDLANGLTLSVEIDEGDTDAARRRLEGLLGPATVIVASGSEWINPETGEVHPKLHLHWRLSEPTRDHEDHGRLRYARDLAARLVGADPTGKPVVHPLRWPGSWNVKAAPRLAHIVAENEAAEVHLTEALDALADAMEMAGLAEAELPRSGASQAPVPIVRSAMQAIPNGEDKHYAEWIDFGYAAYRATGGAPEGFDMWDEWSRKSDKYNATETETTWKRIGHAIEGSHAPRTIGAGTIFYYAKQAGWTRPAPEPPAPIDDPGYLQNQEHEARGEKAPTPEPDTPKPEPATPERGQRYGRLIVLGMDDLDTSPPRSYLLKGLISPGEISIWVGAPKCGKSFLLLHVSYMLSLKRSVFGKRVKQATVLYVAAEGEGGIATRIRALRARYGPSPAFHFIAQPADLLHHDGDLDHLVKAANAIGATLIVLDTLSRLMAGGDENSPVDMGIFVKNVTSLRERTAAHVGIVHHGTKASNGTSPRGHSSLTGADDALIEVAKLDDGSRVATVVHAKDDGDGDRFGFTLERVEMGIDDDGDPITTLLVNEASDPPPQRARLSDNLQIGMKTLHAAMKASAVILNSSDAGEERSAVAETEWRQRFYREGKPGESQETKQKAFRRIVDGLQVKGLIGCRDNFVWPEGRS